MRRIPLARWLLVHLAWGLVVAALALTVARHP